MTGTGQEPKRGASWRNQGTEHSTPEVRKSAISFRFAVASWLCFEGSILGIKDRGQGHRPPRGPLSAPRGTGGRDGEPRRLGESWRASGQEEMVWG